MPVVGFIWSQLRRRAGRSLALLAGVLVATTGFTVLAAATETSRLTVTGALNEARVTYDVLVRPAGSRTALEQARGQVRPNSLTGLYGGVTMAQYEAVKAISGVEVAAPIAMIGYSIMHTSVQVDVTAQVDRSLERQVIRLDRRFRAERGLSQVDAGPTFVYVTRNPIVSVADDTRPPWSDTPARYTDGFVLPASLTRQCGTTLWPPLEVLPDGSHVPLCNIATVPDAKGSARFTDTLSAIDLVQLQPDGRFQRPGAPGAQPPPTDRLIARQMWALPFMVAAIDPVAEARLT